MDICNSHSDNLAYKHLIERKSMLMSEVQSWRELRIRHKQAIQKVGLANFLSWDKQGEEIKELGLRFTSLRVEMRDRQQKELEL